jgi:hypothetical protein
MYILHLINILKITEAERNKNNQQYNKNYAHNTNIYVHHKKFYFHFLSVFCVIHIEKS